MEEKKKSSAGIIIVVVLLFLIAVAGSSFGGYYFGKNANTNAGTETPKTETKELKETDVKDLLQRIELMNSSLCTLYPLTDVSSIPSQNLLSIGFDGRFGVYSVEKDSIEATIKYVVGDNAPIKHEDYLCKNDNIAFYNYQGDYYNYNNDHPGHGGGGGYIVSTFFKDASIKDNTITINTNLLYEVSTDIAGETTSYYDAATNGNKVLNEISRNILKAEYAKIKDTLPTTTFTFVRSELGGYNLKSVTIK